MAEYLDVIDEQGNFTGEVVDRETAHAEGIRHRTTHLWLLRKREGRIQLLLQKRSHNKVGFPDCYDISSAGHVSAGEDFETSALRELEEELGIRAVREELIFCEDRNSAWDGEFGGRMFHDRQRSRVFMMWRDLEENEFTLDPEEVDSVLWMDLEECIQRVAENSFQHNIAMEELMILKKKSETFLC